MMKGTLVRALGATSLIALWAQTAMAQQASAAKADQANTLNPEIIVTAQRRWQKLQDVAGSVQAVSGAALAQTSRNDMASVLQQVPGVSVQGGPAGFIISMRGVGLDQSPNAADAAVTVSRDDVIDTNSTAATVGFFDLQRIEVLRGPQGTLYGRNATGGAVNVLTNDPGRETGGYGQAEVGNYGLLRAEGAANVAATDKLSFRLAGAAVSRNGYYSSGAGGAKAQSLRFKTLYDTRTGVRLMGGVEYTRIDGPGNGDTILINGQLAADPWANVYAPTSAPRNYPTNHYFRANAIKLFGRADFNLGPASLTIIPAHQMLTGDNHYYVTGIYMEALPRSLQDSLEVRLASRASSPVNWILGAFAYRSHTNGASNSYDFTTTSQTSGQVATTTFSQGTANDTTSKTYALFGDVTVPITSTLRVNGGIRQTWDRKLFISNITLPVGSTNAGGIVVNQYQPVQSANFDYKIGVEFEPRKGSLLFAKVSTGYRASGYSNGALRLRNGVPTGQPIFKPEHLTSFEVGSKNRFFDRRLTLNIDAFYYDYKDYQAASSQVFAGSSTPVNITDSANARIYGVDVEGEFNLTAKDRFIASASYLHSEFLSFVSAGNAGYVGQPLSKAPGWTLTGGYEHVIAFKNGSSLTAHVDTKYTGSYKVIYTSTAANGGIQAAQWKTNLNLLFKPRADSSLTLSAYIKNIENNATKNFIVNVPAGPYVTLDAPRTYGMSLRAEF